MGRGFTQIKRIFTDLCFGFDLRLFDAGFCTIYLNALSEIVLSYNEQIEFQSKNILLK
jgi:hypothetical protein